MGPALVCRTPWNPFGTPLTAVFASQMPWNRAGTCQLATRVLPSCQTAGIPAGSCVCRPRPLLKRVEEWKCIKKCCRLLAAQIWNSQSNCPLTASAKQQIDKRNNTATLLLLLVVAVREHIFCCGFWMEFIKCNEWMDGRAGLQTKTNQKLTEQNFKIVKCQQKVVGWSALMESGFGKC